MSQFIDQFSDKFGLNSADSVSIINGLNNQIDTSKEGDKLDYIELFLAVSLNAKLHHATEASSCKRLKLLLNNNNRKAVNIANLWAEGKISFQKMLAII